MGIVPIPIYITSKIITIKNPMLSFYEIHFKTTYMNSYEMINYSLILISHRKPYLSRWNILIIISKKWVIRTALSATPLIFDELEISKTTYKYISGKILCKIKTVIICNIYIIPHFNFMNNGKSQLFIYTQYSYNNYKKWIIPMSSYTLL